MRMTWIAALAALAAMMAAARPAFAGGPKPPNIVFVLVDDLRWDELGCTGHPFAKTPHIDRIAAEGATFRNAFATTPLCSPSRASYLTGRYPHAHGITDNTARDAQSHALVTFPLLLHRAGYRTGFVGKWHMGNDDSPRPGFDAWACLKGQGTSFDAPLNVDGATVPTSGYVTDVLVDRSLAFLEKPGDARPFLLYLSHKGLHPETAQAADGTLSDPNAARFIPADRHKGLYADAPVPRRPNAADTLEGKPALRRPIAGLPPLGPGTGTGDESIRERQRMLASIDEGVGRLREALERSGRLDETVFVVTSDHGYFYGEHGLGPERRLAYEEAIRVPLLVRYPPLLRPGTAVEPMVIGLDLAPTFLDLAGAPTPADIHGRSLLPLLRGEAPSVREAFLIEHSSDKVFPRVEGMGYRAVRTGRWKYIRYRDLRGMDELYDLAADPYEMTNLIADPAHQGTRAELEREMGRLVDASR
ncbi:sulfatase family protein [Tundrisphaera sp. TA3]|uniref:sulfatase family protein n=1 Tax=Tundrisphaera sp. TA3 TaxID=3435775 RepID=UPI003EB9318B